MELGVGVWTDTVQRFYPLDVLKAQKGALTDDLDGRGLLLYFDPKTKIPATLYVETQNATWKSDSLHLDNGQVIRDGVLLNPQNEKIATERPMYLFTRWYGFSKP